jgi:hypothetical protein
MHTHVSSGWRVREGREMRWVEFSVPMLMVWRMKRKRDKGMHGKGGGVVAGMAMSLFFSPFWKISYTLLDLIQG